MSANANDDFLVEDDSGFEDSVTDQELDGHVVTQEQIRDVYFAGTSDGIVILNKGKILDLQAGETSGE